MKQTPIIYGIIAGVGTVIFLGAFYLMDKSHFLNPLVYWSTLLIPVITMVKATRKVKELGGGEIAKVAAIRTGFITWIIAMLFFHGFIYLMFQNDPSLTEILKEMMREARGDKAAETITQMTLGQIFQRMIFMLLPGFLFAYMVASFLKK